jgi:ATP-binding cassette subfamily C (CFTR/MRP) protein 1
MFGVGSFLVEILSVFGVIILCSIYDQFSLIFIPFLSIFGFILTKFYLDGQRPLSRLEKISKSPVLNMVSETIPGSATIRAFKKNNIFINNFYDKINDCYKVNISSKGAYIWYHQEFDFIGLLYSIYIILMTSFFQDNYSVQSVGIMFTYSLLLEKELASTFSMFSEMETSMISMERCYKYTQLTPETNFVLPEDEILKEKNWPKEGKIIFKDLSIKYRPNTETVLRNINLEISPGEKIGICGRTGSGKSTICLSIFRLIEPYKGTIIIDDIDIQKVGLDLLRQKLTYIPQEPILMEGSLRFNIDPFNYYKDEEIIDILKKIGFKYNEDDNKILERHIDVNGNNISIGEKQLICIARAILKKTKILIMDEATANIDVKTEEKIQKILNDTFKECTIITIAHRIKTILNYDKILVLENGKIVEFDSPKILLGNKESNFYKLYEKSSI